VFKKQIKEVTMNFRHTRKVIAIAILFNILHCSSMFGLDRVKKALGYGDINVTYSAVRNPYSAPPLDYWGHIPTEYREYYEFEQATEKPVCISTNPKYGVCDKVLKPGKDVVLPYNTNELYVSFAEKVPDPRNQKKEIDVHGQNGGENILKFGNLDRILNPNPKKPKVQLKTIAIVVGGEGIESIKLNGHETVHGQPHIR
jgi:hypothetical protein